MAPNFLALATTLENLGARRLLAKKVNRALKWIASFERNCGTAWLREWNKTLVLSNELIKVELLPWEI